MKITFTENGGGNTISVSSDNLRTDDELVLEITYKGGEAEAWYRFDNLEDLDEFMMVLSDMRTRFYVHLQSANDGTKS